MAQVLRNSRREPRSLKMWGDRKKAIIKRYPDGRQEIIVPQILTPEQEHYQFPPRSKFLKRLAVSTAKRQRLSVIQSPIASDSMHQLPNQDTITALEMKQPDELAIKKWFSKNEDNKPLSKANKELEVINWINEVERSSKGVPSSTKKESYQRSIASVKPIPSSTFSSCYSNHKIEFKSEAGKRWATNNIITSTTSLLPPDETYHNRYISRKVLLHLPRLRSHNKESTQPVATSTDTTSKVQIIWKDYKSISTPPNLTIKNKMGENTSVTTDLMQLFHMLHDSLKLEQQKSNERLAELEALLEEERKRRQEVERKLKRVEIMYQQRQQHIMMNDGNTTITSFTLTPEREEDIIYQSLLSRMNELELSVKRESQARKTFEENLLNTMEQLQKNRNSITKTRRNTFVPNENQSPMPSTHPMTRRIRDRTSSLVNVGVIRKSIESKPTITTMKNIISKNNNINQRKTLRAQSVPRNSSSSSSNSNSNKYKKIAAYT
ncbi:uncharacterized protein BX663DRAFT_547659 [Cokeromyces recurvatus]|uniref:uncharacterized protein n=1 Tax=Cokeromyces recurvatus TaxID=90255 RepID=UPI0022201668|nr:uncharacterized protein BX663DRAFT_547659 [Cokeromyces recurvatus]KAI7908027.1 hypothetical protein BX663DRAFT_547659 [Cokeromyces recurvatus]